MEQTNFRQKIENEYHSSKSSMPRTQYDTESFELPSSYNLDYLRIKFLSIVRQNEFTIFGVCCKFTADIWDFSQLWELQKKKVEYRFKFWVSDENDFNVIILKLFMFERISKYKISGGNNHSCLVAINELFEFMADINLCRLEDLNEYYLQRYFSMRISSYTTVIKKKYFILDFLKFYNRLTGASLDSKVTFYLRLRNQDKINAQIEANKTTLLPKEFYNKFVTILERKILEGKQDKYILGKYALILIASQTGLRLSGLRLLNVDCLIPVEKNGYRIYKIGLPLTKKRPGSIEQTRYMKANSKIVFAVNYLIDCFSEERLVSNSKALCIGKRSKNGLTSITALSTTIEEFCLNNFNELELLNRKDSSCFEKNIMLKNLRNTKRLLKKYDLKPNDQFSFPTSTQFRVFFPTELYERGLSTFEISYLMGHDTLGFADHYIRPKELLDQDMMFGSEKIIGIIENDLNIIGNSGALYTRKLKEFFHNNTKANVIEISEEFQSKYPIRAKNGGFCIKPVGRDCIYDQNANEFLCSFRICPNHHHLFYEIGRTYQRCQELFIVLESDRKNGFRIEAQKQLHILQAIVVEELLPEYSELCKEIAKRGIEVLDKKYPDICNIVHNLEEVERTIKKWKEYKLI
jgi:hypothetical protein